MWASGNGGVKEYDVVAMQGEGWELIETENRNMLISRDENGDILAQINSSGDSEHLESIYTFDENGRIADLQSIDPEIRQKWGALGPISQGLLALGVVFPPAAVAGGFLSLVHQGANGQLTAGSA